MDGSRDTITHCLNVGNGNGEVSVGGIKDVTAHFLKTAHSDGKVNVGIVGSKIAMTHNIVIMHKLKAGQRRQGQWWDGSTDAITYCLKAGHGDEEVSGRMAAPTDVMTHLLKTGHGQGKVSVGMDGSKDAMTHSLKAVHGHGKVGNTMDQETQ